ncbi:MAG TPA: ribonuclease P protein component [Candidatus Limnocylindria bacterium]
MDAARLRREEDIARVRSEGLVRDDRLFSIRMLSRDEPEVRVAVAASRALGTAVRRNRARRRIREAIRAELRTWDPASGADILIVARRAAIDAPVVEIRATVAGALHRILDRTAR